jgi:hypothetical protein
MPSRIVIYLGLSAALASAHALAQTCNSNIRPTTPTSQFVIDAAKGTVLDKKTGLMWKRCAEGQSGANCATGIYSSYTWKSALTRAVDSTHASYQDWHLPNSKELESLVEEKCSNPAINTTAFPNAPSAWYWSSSPDASDPNNAWYVGFTSGYSDHDLRTGTGYAVRLVRNGQ